MNNNIVQTMDMATVIGGIRLYATDNTLLQLELLWRETSATKAASAFLAQVAAEIERYLTDPTFKFTINYQLHATPFQQRVLQTLTTIKAGKVATYGDLAEKLQTSARAIGNACRINPLPLILPCHRVVAKSNLGGYAGSDPGRLKIKQWLLRHEGAVIT